MSWLECRPRTGRTHQIRVHCAALGCPVLGDPIYGEGGPPTRRRCTCMRVRSVAALSNRAPSPRSHHRRRICWRPCADAAMLPPTELPVEAGGIARPANSSGE